MCAGINGRRLVRAVLGFVCVGIFSRTPLSIAAANGELILADKGVSAFRIVVAAGASPSTKYGAEELRRFLHETSRVKLPIVSDGEPLGEHEIILGENAHLASLGVRIDFEKLGPEGYVLRTHHGHLVIAGGALRGNLYGVYGLLGDHLGCRWFMPAVSRIPQYERLVVGPLNETQIPVFESRDTQLYDCREGDWSARNRLNGHNNQLEQQNMEVGLPGTDLCTRLIVS